jgi:hypothetical protein
MRQKKTNDLFKTIVDQDLGTFAILNENKDTVSLKDKAGKVIWSTNIIDGLKTVSGKYQSSPDRELLKIRDLQLYKGDLYAHVGRGFAIIDKKNGSLTGFDSN